MLQKTARFSVCRTYRYRLTRIWDVRSPRIYVVGLNPSTADECVDDPTIRRCVSFAKREGAGGIHMLNLFAYRATDPRELLTVEDPIGPENCEEWAAIPDDAVVIAAWGRNRLAKAVAIDFFSTIQRSVLCLGTTKDGSPRHPLYVRKDAPLVRLAPVGAH